MIARLKGKIIFKSTEEVVIDTGGVGYEVRTTLTTYEKLPEDGEMVELHIYTHVREDNISLYGFFSETEKRLFKKLIKINGVGPKLAISILSGVPPEDFITAVTGEDIARLNAIPGVGKKTAERIIVDLKDKLIKEHNTIISTGGMSHSMSGVYDDALSALLNLGYKRPSAEMALAKVGVSKDAELTTVIKESLKELAN